jgi:hypothetical protein
VDDKHVAPAGALETSFWAATALTEAHGYMLRMFQVHCGAAVEAEVTNENPPELRPSAALFRELVRHGQFESPIPRR